MARKSAKNRARSRPAYADPSPAAVVAAEDVHASDPAAVHFFSAPPVTYDDVPAELVDVVHEPSARRVPANPERRRRLMRVVAGAVALSSAICVAAAVRVATVHAATGGVAHASEVAQVPLPAATASALLASSSPAAAPLEPQEPPQPDQVANTVVADTPAAQAAPAPPTLPSVVSAAVEEPAVPAAAATPAAATAPAPMAPTAPAAATAPTAASKTDDDKVPVEVDPAAALAAKRTSQRALDRGDAKTSIAAGEESVALDPTDAEAWLILGAAYQTKGSYTEARRCFSSCVRLGKRGPRGECSALLR